jgi:hypothetical protein
MTEEEKNKLIKDALFNQLSLYMDEKNALRSKMDKIESVLKEMGLIKFFDSEEDVSASFPELKTNLNVELYSLTDSFYKGIPLHSALTLYFEHGHSGTLSGIMEHLIQGGLKHKNLKPALSLLLSKWEKKGLLLHEKGIWKKNPLADWDKK